MKIIYIKETEETCDIIQRVALKIKRMLNIIKVDKIKEKTIYYLPVFDNTKISKYRIKKLSKKIYTLLEKHCSNIVALSQNLEKNQSLKNNLYSQNINILDGKYLFRCLTYQTIEHIFKIKNKEMKFRRGFIVN